MNSITPDRVGGPSNSFEVHACGDHDVLRLQEYLLGKVIWAKGTGLSSSVPQLEEWTRARQIANDVLLATGLFSDEVAIRRLFTSVFICGYGFLDHYRDKHNLDDVLSADDDTFRELIGGYLWHGEARRIFVTSDNYIGLGPRLTRYGDKLFIALGGCWVHIVRPEDDHFSYVGIAYVPGLMDGEVLGKGIEPRIIDIR